MDENKKELEGAEGAQNAPAASLTPRETVAKKDAEPAPKQAGTVTLSAESFAELMKRLELLEGSQELLLQVQDKNKIAKIEELRRAGKLVKSVKIRKYAGKYITGWKTLEDEVYKDENGRLVEKQIVKLFFADGSDMEMAMRQWANAPEYETFDVTKESKDNEGNLFFTCLGADGSTIEMNANFIN